jgi:hypothetical protein
MIEIILLLIVICIILWFLNKKNIEGYSLPAISHSPSFPYAKEDPLYYAYFFYPYTYYPYAPYYFSNFNH